MRESNPNPDNVHDEQSFLDFVRELLEDRRLASQIDEGLYGAPRGWQNHSVESFLEGSLSWAEDSSFGRTLGLSEGDSVWHRVAVFLYCGKIYE